MVMIFLLVVLVTLMSIDKVEAGTRIIYGNQTWHEATYVGPKSSLKYGLKPGTKFNNDNKMIGLEYCADDTLMMNMGRWCTSAATFVNSYGRDTYNANITAQFGLLRLNLGIFKGYIFDTTDLIVVPYPSVSMPVYKRVILDVIYKPSVNGYAFGSLIFKWEL